MSLGNETVFLLMVNGQIETAEFPQYDDIYCRYQYVFGQDWDIASGLEEGLSQTVKKSQDGRQIFVINFPLEVGFKSTNPFGWPRIVIHVYGYDLFGNDVIRGYGMTHIPTVAGRHVKTIPLFVPESSSQIQQLISWLTSRRPELSDPRILAEGDGREVTRMKTQGRMTMSFNVITKNLKSMGFRVDSSSSSSSS
ncbi:hypothetical protein HELRODRAFT_88997 [Helobdella robusta]|uniref:B9 domain-containing protein 1 n=1 Tax=Helobdella robusta TaxID=6412 RepID=T1G780_HELRO|nr:hypothetical protein HELRODRAFT_88997 [Helobdella robusta]ESN93351.1 hypothetical protein HELRODRAFT_88997 [Helobdella robusta]